MLRKLANHNHNVTTPPNKFVNCDVAKWNCDGNIIYNYFEICILIASCVIFPIVVTCIAARRDKKAKGNANKKQKQWDIEDEGKELDVSGTEKFTRQQLIEIWLQKNGVAFIWVLFFGQLFFYQFFRAVRLESLQNPKSSTFLYVAVSIGRFCGMCTNITMACCILFMAKIPLTYLASTRFEFILPLREVFDLHRYMAWASLIGGTIHGTLQTANFIIDDYNWKYMADGCDWEDPTFKCTLFSYKSTYISGWVIFSIFGVMGFSHRPWFMKLFRTNYQTFLWIHKHIWLLLITVLLIHGNQKGVPVFWKYIIFPLIFLILHYAASLTFQQYCSVILPTTTCITTADGTDIIKLEILRNGFTFHPGHYAQLKIDALGDEWHPFTIASSPNEDRLLFCIHCVGDWTKSLRDLLFTECTSNPCSGFKYTFNIKNQASIEKLAINIRGPFGAPSTSYDSHENLVLVGAGIGATPFLSVVKDVVLKHRTANLLHSMASEYSSVEMEDTTEAQRLLLKQYQEKSRNSQQIKAKDTNALAERFHRSLILPAAFGFLAFMTEQVICAMPQYSTTGVSFLPFVNQFTETTQETIVIIGVVLMAIFVAISLMHLGMQIYTFRFRRYFQSIQTLLEAALTLPYIAMFWYILFDSVRMVHQNEYEDYLDAVIFRLNNINYILSLYIYFSYCMGMILRINRINGNKIFSGRVLLYLEDATNVTFIYVGRDQSAAAWLTDELAIIEKQAAINTPNLKLNFTMFFTRETEESFKPHLWKLKKKPRFGRPDWGSDVYEPIMNNLQVLKMKSKLTSVSDVALTDGRDGIVALPKASSVYSVPFDDEDSKTVSVGLFFCGNERLGRTIRNKSYEASKGSKFYFDFYAEKF